MLRDEEFGILIYLERVADRYGRNRTNKVSDDSLLSDHETVTDIKFFIKKSRGPTHLNTKNTGGKQNF